MIYEAFQDWSTQWLFPPLFFWWLDVWQWDTSDQVAWNWTYHPSSCVCFSTFPLIGTLTCEVRSWLTIFGSTFPLHSKTLSLLYTYDLRYFFHATISYSSTNHAFPSTLSWDLEAGYLFPHLSCEALPHESDWALLLHSTCNWLSQSILISFRFLSCHRCRSSACRIISFKRRWFRKEDQGFVLGKILIWLRFLFHLLGWLFRNLSSSISSFRRFTFVGQVELAQDFMI